MVLNVFHLVITFVLYLACPLLILAIAVRPDPPVNVRVVASQGRRVLVKWSHPPSWPDPLLFPLKYKVRYYWGSTREPRHTVEVSIPHPNPTHRCALADPREVMTTPRSWAWYPGRTHTDINLYKVWTVILGRGVCWMSESPEWFNIHTIHRKFRILHTTKKSKDWPYLTIVNDEYYFLSFTNIDYCIQKGSSYGTECHLMLVYVDIYGLLFVCKYIELCKVWLIIKNKP